MTTTGSVVVSATNKSGERYVTRAELAWAVIHKRCEKWYAMKKRIDEQLERQEAQERHEAAQRKRVSNGRLAEMRRRNLAEFGEEEEDGHGDSQIA
jgi:hypothetical protein